MHLLTQFSLRLTILLLSLYSIYEYIFTFCSMICISFWSWSYTSFIKINIPSKHSTLICPWDQGPGLYFLSPNGLASSHLQALNNYWNRILIMPFCCSGFSSIDQKNLFGVGSSVNLMWSHLFIKHFKIFWYMFFVHLVFSLPHS